MLKILQARLQQYVNRELPDVQAGFRKGRGQQLPHYWKRSVFISIPKKGNAKECSNYCTIALISHASKVMLKILQARLQQYVNREHLEVHGSRIAEAWLGEF